MATEPEVVVVGLVLILNSDPCFGLFVIPLSTDMSSAIHDERTRYCKVTKKTFSAQGWPCHVQACEMNMVKKHMEKKMAITRNQLFEGGPGTSSNNSTAAAGITCVSSHSQALSSLPIK